MQEDVTRLHTRFRPLRPTSGPRLIGAFILGPLLWLVALIVAALIFHHSDAIQLGLLVAIASCLLAAVVLTLLRRGRRREEDRYADRA